MIFRKFFTSFLLGIFGLFLVSPQMALGKENQEIILVNSGISDTCTWNISCEKISDTQYICRSAGELLSNLGSSIHQIPAGKSGTDTAILSVPFWNQNITSLQEKENIYKGPDTFVYPFVRVIKIQV